MTDLSSFYTFTFNCFYQLYSIMLGTWWLAVIVLCGLLSYVVNLIRNIQGKKE